MNDDAVKLLVEANSIQDPEDLRLPQSEVDARCDAIVTRRLTMTSTPTRVEPYAEAPPPYGRRSMAWAFVAGFAVVLLVIGAAVLFLRGEQTPVAGEEPDVTSDEPWLTANLEAWRQVAIEERWVGSIADVEPLPDGGYVVAVSASEDLEAAEAAGTDLSSVMWSPDGVDWFDGDPQRLVPQVKGTFTTSHLAVVGDQVVVLEAQYDEWPTWVHGIALWIGDPRTGIWERLLLDTGGVEDRLVGNPHLADNGGEVLVSSFAVSGDPGDLEEGLGTEIVTWVVDPSQQSSVRTSFAIPLTLLPGCRDRTCPEDLVGTDLVEWVDERWIHFAYHDVDGPDGVVARTTLWTSRDGRSWSHVTLPDGMHGVYSVVAGPTGAVAAVCSGSNDGAWYSPDGLEWARVPTPSLYPIPQAVDSHQNPVIASWGDRGFVVWGSGRSGVRLVAHDGSSVGTMPSPFDGATVASASGDTLIAVSEDGALWLYRQPPDE